MTSTQKQWDLLIVGAGPTGLACAIEAQKAGLSALILEKGCLVNSIFNYPTQMVFFTTAELLEIGGIPMTSASAKPTRLEAMEYYRKVAAHFKLTVHLYERVETIIPGNGAFRVTGTTQTGRATEYTAGNVVIATGYYDLHNYLNVPGEDLPQVFHYYKEPHPFAGCKVLVIGGKNSSVDTALDLWRHGAAVTLVHRRAQLSDSIKYWVRPDIENRLKAGEISGRFETSVLEIQPERVLLRHHPAKGAVHEEWVAADFVFALVGYHPDFAFLQAVGVGFDSTTQRPTCNPETFESNVPGLYLGGVVVAGRHTGEIFIENGRFHGGVIVRDIVKRSTATPMAAR